MQYSRSSQNGMFLLEALVAILIFVLGILGMVSVSAMAISAQSDAQYRSEAGRIASDMAQKIALRVTRTSNPADLQTSLGTFAHQATGDGATCNYSGAAATTTDAAVTDFTTLAQRLPGTTAAMQQIVVDTSGAGYNRVTINVCWQAPSDSAKRRYTLAALVN